MKLPRWMRPSRRYVTNNRVYCPNQRTDMDVDVCATCTRLRSLREDEHGLYMKCEAPGVTEPPSRTVSWI